MIRASRSSIRFTLHRRAALALLAALVACASAHAQAAAPAVAAQAAPLAYDVVTVKPNKSGDRSVSINVNNDVFSASNVSVKMLLENSYGTKDDLIFGLPKWTDDARFDLTAKMLDADPAAVRKLTDEQRMSMLKPVLADRFKLQLHTETRVLPVYDLVVAKTGPKFKAAAIDSKTGKRMKEGGWMSIRNTKMTAYGVPVQSLADSLAHRLHRTIIDKTGLTGDYDFELNWASEDGASGSSESSDASIFTALEEQLGLKLESSKGPVETLIVDHIEAPTED